MELRRVIVEIISCLIEMWIAAFFFSAFRERRIQKKWLITAVFAVGAVYAALRITFLYFDKSIFIVSILLTFLVSLCYRFKIHNAVLMSIVISVISMISEVVMGIIMTFSGISVQDTRSNIYLYIIAILLSKFLTCLVVVLVHKGRHQLFQSARGNKFLGILLLPVATVLLMIVISYLLYRFNINNLWKSLMLVALVVLIIANITIFYIIDRQYELISAKQKLKMSAVLLENQRNYYDHVFESQQEIRRIRHDLKNSFIGVLTKIDSGDIDEARRMVQSQLSDTERNIDLSSRETDNLINSVIYSKKRAALNRGILLTSDVKIRAAIVIDDLDLAVLLGNLLDNAIEAAAKVTEAPREIELTIFVKQGSMEISCTNPVARDVDVNHIETIKSDKRNHGFGLLSIKSIVEKYDGIYTISCKNNVFSFFSNLSNDT